MSRLLSSKPARTVISVWSWFVLGAALFFIVPLVGLIRLATWRDAGRYRAGLMFRKVAVVHHPLVEMIGGPMTGRVWGGQAAARALAEGGVDLVLSGHVHAPFVWPYPFAGGAAHAVGAGTLSVRERGVAPSFNLIEADAGEIRVVAQGWTGSRFEPLRSWAVDRRRQNARPG